MSAPGSDSRRRGFPSPPHGSDAGSKGMGIEGVGNWPGKKKEEKGRGRGRGMTNVGYVRPRDTRSLANPYREEGNGRGRGMANVGHARPRARPSPGRGEKGSIGRDGKEKELDGMRGRRTPAEGKTTSSMLVESKPAASKPAEGKTPASMLVESKTAEGKTPASKPAYSPPALTEDDVIELKKHLIKYWDNSAYLKVIGDDTEPFKRAIAKLMSRRELRRWMSLLNEDENQVLERIYSHKNGKKAIISVKKMMNHILSVETAKILKKKEIDDKLVKQLFVWMSKEKETDEKWVDLIDQLMKKFSIWGKIEQSPLDFGKINSLDADASKRQVKMFTEILDNHTQLIETVLGIYDWTQNIDMVYHDNETRYFENFRRVKSTRRRLRILAELYKFPDRNDHNEIEPILDSTIYNYTYILVSWLRHSFPFVDGSAVEVQLMNHITGKDAATYLKDSACSNEFVQNLEVLFKLIRFGKIVDETRDAAIAAFTWREAVNAQTETDEIRTIKGLLNRIQMSMCNSDIVYLAYPLLTKPTMEQELKFAEQSVIYTNA